MTTRLHSRLRRGKRPDMRRGKQDSQCKMLNLFYPPLLIILDSGKASGTRILDILISLFDMDQMLTCSHLFPAQGGGN